MSDERAYGRVTNPERFAPLHEASAALIRDLEARYQVAVKAAPRDRDGNVHEVLMATRVSPDNDGAPVTVTWTAFPGLSVRFGQWHIEWFPRCGCDACDEQLDDLLNDLRRKVAAVVAGTFTETPNSHDFIYPDGGNSGSSGGHVRRWFRVRTRRYPAWPRRTP